MSNKKYTPYVPQWKQLNKNPDFINFSNSMNNNPSFNSNNFPKIEMVNNDNDDDNNMVNLPDVRSALDETWSSVDDYMIYDQPDNQLFENDIMQPDNNLANSNDSIPSLNISNSSNSNEEYFLFIKDQFVFKASKKEIEEKIKELLFKENIKELDINVFKKIKIDINILITE